MEITEDMCKNALDQLSRMFTGESFTIVKYLDKYHLLFGDYCVFSNYDYIAVPQSNSMHKAFLQHMIDKSSTKFKAEVWSCKANRKMPVIEPCTTLEQFFIKLELNEIFN